jgi:hypothetical protein
MPIVAAMVRTGTRARVGVYDVDMWLLDFHERCEEFHEHGRAQQTADAAPEKGGARRHRAVLGFC